MADTSGSPGSCLGHFAAVVATTVALLGGGAAGCNPSLSDFKEAVTCLDPSTLHTCGCDLIDRVCSCRDTSCQPGACVTSHGFGFCATSPSPWPDCDPTQAAQSVCDGPTMAQCQYGYRLPGAPCSGVCVSAGGVSICSVSANPAPPCDPTLPAQTLCDGETPYHCQFGYRTQPLAPGRPIGSCDQAGQSGLHRRRHRQPAMHRGHPRPGLPA